MDFEQKPTDKKQDLLHTSKDEPSYLIKGSTAAKADKSSNLIIILLAILAIAVIASLAVFLFFYNGKKTSKQRPESNTVTNEATTSQRLPDFGNGGVSNGNDEGNDYGTDLEGEKLAFGSYYKENEEDIQFKLNNYNLPINVKSDVSNYYDISRKLILDDYIEELNQNGFAIIDNPFTESAQDFYGTYGELNNRGIPTLVTSDFLMYYYQESLKQIYKDIEGNVFYPELWAISKDMFEMADSNYREYSKQVGVVNDPVLEAQRRVVAYFAVILKLLEPKISQVDYKTDYSEDKFTADELAIYTQALPFYLQEDVNKELAIIAKAGGVNKSPVLLYQRDYSDFVLTSEYREKAKLTNFYRASRWMNSLFPLYFQNESCPDCLLDRDDWLVSILSANYIAKLFESNQELKNRWAKLYKVISYFSGLRSDLTYLHYLSAGQRIFGDDYDVIGTFSKNNPKLNENIVAFQNELAKIDFLDIEGNYSRDDLSVRPYLGMRMLQEAYWPNEYIFDNLVSPKVNKYIFPDHEKVDREYNVTACSRDINIFYRCTVFGPDIANLLYEIPAENPYYLENTYYEGYNENIRKIRNELANFTKFSWHANSYWTTLDINKKYLEDKGEAYPPYTKNYKWEARKINAALSGWVNAQLSADEFSSIYQQSAGLGAAYANEFNYVEPEYALISELVSNTEMLTKTMLALEVIDDTSLTFKKFVKLSDELRQFKTMIAKEAKGEELSDEDVRTIDWFTKQYSTSNSVDKRISIRYSTKVLKENIRNTKLLLVIYTMGDSKLFAVGPVYEIREY